MATKAWGVNEVGPEQEPRQPPSSQVNEVPAPTIEKSGDSTTSTGHSSTSAVLFPLTRPTSDWARTRSSGWPSSTSDCSNQFWPLMESLQSTWLVRLHAEKVTCWRHQELVAERIKFGFQTVLGSLWWQYSKWAIAEILCIKLSSQIEFQTKSRIRHIWSSSSPWGL